MQIFMVSTIATAYSDLEKALINESVWYCTAKVLASFQVPCQVHFQGSDLFLNSIRVWSL